ncbi:uncharacterized protein domain protein [Halorubrum sp. AJ67]|nr:uncharacterized protein domain protein [Halorubrum sp. AJ67]
MRIAAAGLGRPKSICPPLPDRVVMTTGDRIERDVESAADERPTVAATRCSQERTVFTEQGNTDAWIATDLTVDLER